MSKYYQVILDILEGTNETYEKLHPEIKDKSTFSISTLSHRNGVSKQIQWKLSGATYRINYDTPLGKAMFQGRAVHEFVQARLQGFTKEFRLSWLTETFKLTGHVDAINFDDRYLIEMKTSKKHKYYANLKKPFVCSKCRLPIFDRVHDIREMEYSLKEYVIQTGAYVKVLELQTGNRFGASVFLINDSLIEYELTREDIEKSWIIILSRARETFEKLN